MYIEPSDIFTLPPPFSPLSLSSLVKLIGQAGFVFVNACTCLRNYPWKPESRGAACKSSRIFTEGLYFEFSSNKLFSFFFLYLPHSGHFQNFTIFIIKNQKTSKKNVHIINLNLKNFIFQFHFFKGKRNLKIIH